MSAIKYRPEVDGLRAIAVIPVVLFHLGASWIPGGFVGVDVFFVISGYLITSIILKEQAAGTFTFKDFWMRRIRRILPALLAMLFATSVASYFMMFGPVWKGIGQQVFSAIFLYANIEMWQLSGNYWGPAAENAPLLHTWSLSVEEQFYLFYPLLLLILLKFTPKRVFTLILCGSVLSLAICVYATEHHANAAFYFLPARAWELAAGCLLAVFNRSRGPAPTGNISRTLAFTGLLLIGAGYCLIQGAKGFPGFWALMPVVGSVLVIRFSGGEKCLAGRLLSWSPVVYIGKCSYSLYLWHWPVIVLAAAVELKQPGSVNLPIVVAFIVVFTLLSYHFIEKPTRKMAGVMKPVILGLVASIALASFLMNADYNYNLSRFAPVQTFNPSYDVSPIASVVNQDSQQIVVRSAHQPEQLIAYAKDGILRQYGGETPDIVVLGSSHALMWAKVIDEIAEELGLSVSFFTARGTPPLIEFPVSGKPAYKFNAEQKKVFDETRLAKIKEWSPQLVIVVDRWSLRTDIPAYDELLHYIKDCGSEVLLLGQPPEAEVGDYSVPLFVAYQTAAAPDFAKQTLIHSHRVNEVAIGNERVESLSTTSDFVHFLSVHDLYIGGKSEVLVRDGDQVLYLDEDHLSYAGALRGKERIKSKITDLVK
jgi:peptidoglycan/LPS O-acetylase OafA/YrhL